MSDWTDGENVNAVKMTTRITTPLDALVSRITALESAAQTPRAPGGVLAGSYDNTKPVQVWANSIIAVSSNSNGVRNVGLPSGCTCVLAFFVDAVAFSGDVPGWTSYITAMTTGNATFQVLDGRVTGAGTPLNNAQISYAVTGYLQF